MISQRCFAFTVGLALSAAPALAVDKKEKEKPVEKKEEAAKPATGDTTITSKCFFDVTIAGKPAGQIVIGVYGKAAPKTAANFMEICKGEKDKANPKGLKYAGSPFHRVIPGFMLQGGDITLGNGMGGESIYGTKFEDENLTLKHTEPGTLSMANAGPNTNGSQFFITTAATPWLDGHHVVFGKVVAGLDIVKKIEEQGSGSGQTKAPIVVVKAGEKK